jgi:hypothetical protein
LILSTEHWVEFVLSYSLFPIPYSLVSYPCARRSIAQVTTPVIET